MAIELTQQKEHECPECGEYLMKVKSGMLTSKEDGPKEVFVCNDECDQAYVIHEGKIAFVPFDSNMEKIQEICLKCNHREEFRQKMCFVINEHFEYDTFCKTCAKVVMNNSGLFKKPIETDEELEAALNVYDLHKNNQYLQEMNKRVEQK